MALKAQVGQSKYLSYNTSCIAVQNSNVELLFYLILSFYDIILGVPKYAPPIIFDRCHNMIFTYFL